MHDLLAQFSDGCLGAADVMSAVAGVWDSVWPYLVMIFGFSVIVFVHELGHFMVAKWAGVRVERFAVGFGKELCGFTRGETRYSFNALPLGGYVKMLGQEDFDDKSEELKFVDDPRSFINKPVGHRMAIVSAGVIMNILFACLLFMIVFMVGKEGHAPRVAVIEADSPAEQGGMLQGDVIKEINGTRVLTFDDVTMGIMLAPPHEPIEFVVERDGQTRHKVYVTPEQRRPEGTRGGSRLMIGISSGHTSEIVAVAPQIDETVETNPHVGDRIVEVDGLAVTDDNVNQLLTMLGYTYSNIIVERPDPQAPDAAPKRVRISIPPLLSLYPSDPSDRGTASVLGLRPLFRFFQVYPGSRAELAGLAENDTILAWDDQSHPSLLAVASSIRDQAEIDIAFTVRKSDGTILRGFVRPKRDKKGRGTIAAVVRPMDPAIITEDGPKALFGEVRPGGPADQAGIKMGDRVLAAGGVPNPTAASINRVVRSRERRPIVFEVLGADGSKRTCRVTPAAPGTIGAQFQLIAEDVLRLGEPVMEVDGVPTPAARCGIQAGAEMLQVDGRDVSSWTELINAFRARAGHPVELKYVDAYGQTKTASFEVPHCLRSILGVGPEARILSIDGKDSVEIERGGRKRTVAVRYHAGTRAVLKELIGEKNVPVEFQANPLAPVETRYIDVTADMIDPWLARVAFMPYVGLADEMTTVKGTSAMDAVSIGFHQTYYVILQVYQVIKRMLVTRSVGVENISGPLGIVSIGGKIARMGWVDTFFFMALISANLAVINFLPLPIVDGGLMIFLIIEKIKGSPVSLKVQVATQMIGLALIISCFIMVTYNDALRLWG